jgi:hypothetical protein
MSIYLYNHKNRGDIMALSKSNVPQEAVEEVVQPVEKKTNQVSFDDLEFDAVYEDEEEATPKFFTISGKESWYEPNWTKYGIRDLDVGDEFEGRPELQIFENEDKTYNALRLRVMDDGEILDLYLNFPKKDFPYVNNITKGFDFYRTCFDFIFSVLRWKSEGNVVDEQGEEVNKFRKVNLENFAKFVDSMERVGVKVTPGNPDSEYNSWIIYKME